MKYEPLPKPSISGGRTRFRKEDRERTPAQRRVFPGDRTPAVMLRQGRLPFSNDTVKESATLRPEKACILADRISVLTSAQYPGGISASSAALHRKRGGFGASAPFRGSPYYPLDYSGKFSGSIAEWDCHSPRAPAPLLGRDGRGRRSISDRLPLPFVLDVPIRGPGRYLHFLFAWAAVLTGLFYVLYGIFSRHFRKNLMPRKGDLSWQSVSTDLRIRRPQKKMRRPTILSSVLSTSALYSFSFP